MSQPTNDMPPFQIFTDFTIFAGRFRFNFVDSDNNLGEGSYGEVVKGWDQENENDKRTSGWVAIKRSFSANDQSIKREYEVAKDLGNDHDNVMRYLAYGRLSTPHVGVRDYLVMPYYPDGNLHQFIRNNALTTTQIHSLARGILSGLVSLHRHKRQHRDLKGSNILIGRDPKSNKVVPVIADFGSAKLVTQSNSESFSQSEHAKTIANAAPEQILGESSVNYNLDLWAFGVILYEIMAGQHPFNYGLDELEPTTARSTLTKRIVNAALPEKTKKIAEPYQTMIRQCLVVDRKKRVQKAEELLKILDTYKAPEPGTDPFVVAAEVERKNKSDWTLLGIFGLILLILFFYILTKSPTTTDDSLSSTDLTSMMSDTIETTDTTMVSDSILKAQQTYLGSTFREGLAPIKKVDKWGFVDKNGQIVIDPQFDATNNFSEGLAGVKSGDKYGFTDKTGHIVIDLQFDDVEEFSEGLAGVKKGNNWGFINKKGQVIIQPQFDSYNRIFSTRPKFREGLAGVKKGDKWGFINNKGQFVINPQFDDIGIMGTGGFFSQGLALVKSGEKYGFIDRTGQIVIDLKFGRAREFSEGLAYVIHRPDEDIKHGFIDKTGQVIFTTDYVGGRFKEELAHMEKGDKHGFIDKTGHIVIDLQFDDAEDFNEGVACVKKGDHYGFIDKNGRWVIQPRFDYAYSFSEELAKVTLSEREFFINKLGQCVINCP